jgi:hypothetical protein
MIKIFPLPTKHKIAWALDSGPIPCTYMKSILLSFSLRVAGGVLRRKKSKTIIVTKAHMGRLRSGRSIYDTDRTTNRIQLTKYPSPMGNVESFRMSVNSQVANRTPTNVLAEPMIHQ